MAIGHIKKKCLKKVPKKYFRNGHKLQMVEGEGRVRVRGEWRFVIPMPETLNSVEDRRQKQALFTYS
jgi:hypothetical protein